MAATSIEGKIIDGLMTQFATIVLPDGVSVAYPNVAFMPDGTNAYVRLTIAKNTPVTHDIGGTKEPERMGIFLATVCWPKGEGLIAGSDVANTIRDAFKYTTKIDSGGIRIRVTEQPTVQGDIVTDNYVEIPVTIPWHVYP